MHPRDGQNDHRIINQKALRGLRKSEAELFAAATPVVRYMLKPPEADAHVGPDMMANAIALVAHVGAPFGEPQG
jgi:hypothetical protein